MAKYQKQGKCVKCKRITSSLDENEICNKCSKLMVNNPKGYNKHKKNTEEYSEPVMTKEEMYNRIRELTQKVRPMKTEVRKMDAEIRILRDEYFEI